MRLERLRRNELRRKYLAAIFFILFIAIGTIIFDLIKPFLNPEFGIHPTELLIAFGVAEIFFTGSVLVILRSCQIDLHFDRGSVKSSWDFFKRLHNLRGLKINCWNRTAMSAWLINRVSWITPLVYLSIRGWNKFPWIVHLLILFEILSTVGAGYSAVEIVRTEKDGE